MAPSFRGRLQCFYCGSKSDQKWSVGLKQWLCKKCEAVNHLDENGEIADPSPMSGMFSSVRYVQEIERPSSPVFDIQEESIFCKTCQKNQHIYNQTLASYFPDPDVPDYEEYEKEYPRFRNRLEEQYPQVCEECEPKVRERLQATSYAAKTDHLRRVIDRTRGQRILHHGSSWKSFVVFLGGIFWAANWAGQALWNGVGIFKSMAEYDGLSDEDITLSASHCVQQSINGLYIAPGCTELADWVARTAILLGIFSCWWNPRLQQKLQRRGGKIVGKLEYYFLQALLLGARCAMYGYLTTTSGSLLDPQLIKGIHSASLFFVALTLVKSYRSIRIDYTPRVIFQESPLTLVSRRSQQTEIIKAPAQPNINHNVSQIIPTVRPFSINDFAPPTQQQYPPAYRPPTPPPDEGGDEAMDWTPSQQTDFRPTSLYRDPSPALQQTQPSPFHGHLPADVVSQAHRLRNPPNQPTFRKASVKQKQSFFQTPDKRARRYAEMLSDTTSFAKTTLSEFSPKKFANPRFFPNSDHADTGLEDILSKSFSIAEEPAEIREIQQQRLQEQGQGLLAANPSINWTRAWFILLLSAGFLLWFGLTRTSTHT